MQLLLRADIDTLIVHVLSNVYWWTIPMHSMMHRGGGGYILVYLLAVCRQCTVNIDMDSTLALDNI